MPFTLRGLLYGKPLNMRTESDVDELCEAGPMSELIAERKSMGCDVVEVRWKDSRHCAHLIDKRDEYLRHLREFIVSSAS